MGVESVIAIVLVGAVAGWLAGKLVKGRGFGLVGNIVVGVIGAVVAGFLFPALGFAGPGGVISSVVHATIGAVVLLLLIRVIKQV